ncbi:MAG: amidohydrolase family protein [Candidatus Dormibacteraceae bacterium]
MGATTHATAVIIDCHGHLFPQSAVAAEALGKMWFGSSFEGDLGRPPVIVTGERRSALGSIRHREPPQVRLGRLDELGVDLQLVSVMPSLYRYELDTTTAEAAARAINDEIIDMVQAAPNRLAGLATVPMQDSALAIAELERTKAAGLKGISIGSHVNGNNLDSVELFPIFEAAAEAGALVFCHPTYPRSQGALSHYYLNNLIGNPLETMVAASSLIFGKVLDRLPDLVVLLSHGGGYFPAGLARLDHGWQVRPEVRSTSAAPPVDYVSRFYYDTITHDPLSLRRLIETSGGDRVVMGSDFPADMGAADPVGSVRAAHFEMAVEEAVLHGNAERMLGL